MKKILIDEVRGGIIVNGSFVAMPHGKDEAIEWCLEKIYEEWEIWDGQNLIENQINALNRALSILNDFIFRPYTSDLNAINILEKDLDEQELLEYRDNVVQVLGSCAWYQSTKILSAPARVRAIVMFKTLKNSVGINSRKK